MFDKGCDLDWFNLSIIIILIVVLVIFLIFLVIWELILENLIFDFSLFKFRNFIIGIVSIICVYLFYFGVIVFMLQLFQEMMGYNVIWVGFVYAFIGIMLLLILFLIGCYGNKIDMWLLVIFSFLMYVVCYYWCFVIFMLMIDFIGIILLQFFQGFVVVCFFLFLIMILFLGLLDNKFVNVLSMSNFFCILLGLVGMLLIMMLWG